MALFRKKNNAAGYLLLILFLAVFHLLGIGSGFFKGLKPDGRQGLFIQVEGAVPNPGVYLLYRGDDLATLLHKSGYVAVPLPDFSGLPQLVSGNRVLVEKNQKGPYVTVAEMPAFYKLTLSIPLSLNRATEEGLCAIPGIGPSMAQKIVAERTKRGGFRDLSELRAVKGIGPKKFEQFKPFLTL
jgi:competence protein ComEA